MLDFYGTFLAVKRWPRLPTCLIGIALLGIPTLATSSLVSDDREFSAYDPCIPYLTSYLAIDGLGSSLIWETLRLDEEPLLCWVRYADIGTFCGWFFVPLSFNESVECFIVMGIWCWMGSDPFRCRVGLLCSLIIFGLRDWIGIPLLIRAGSFDFSYF